MPDHLNSGRFDRREEKNSADSSRRPGCKLFSGRKREIYILP
jgi:hypothetical protein